MLRFAVVEICTYCNQACTHCYLGRRGNQRMRDVGFVLEQLVEVGCERVTVSGGEPFTVPDLLIETVSAAKGLGLTVWVVTNGTLFRTLPTAALQAIDHLQVSLDGPRQVHDEIRGVGAFDAVMDGLGYLADVYPATKTSVQMTVSSRNQHSFAETYDLVRSLGLRMSVERVTSVGNATGDPGISPDVYRGILNAIVSDGLLSSDPLVNALKFEGVKVDPSRLGLCGGCSAGREGMAVTVEGDVLPCVRIRESCGNVYSDRLDGVLSSERFRSYGVAPSECLHCRYQTVCGGCRAEHCCGQRTFCVLT